MKSPNYFEEQNLPNSQSNISESEITSTPANSQVTKSLSKRIPTWQFLLPLVLQMGLILSVPAQAIYTHVTGKTVVLQTAPVDPYDFLRGYYQILSYDISNTTNLQKLPGWDEVAGDSDRNFLPNRSSLYVVLEAPTEPGKPGKPTAWKPVRVSKEFPENLPENQIAIKGRYEGWQIKYGLETYFMPESKKDAVNDDIRDAQRGQGGGREPIPFVVEVKVNSGGQAVPVSLWVRDRNYRF